MFGWKENILYKEHMRSNASCLRALLNAAPGHQGDDGDGDEDDGEEMDAEQCLHY